MRNPIFNPKTGVFSLIAFLLFSASSLNVNPPVCDNPTFPGCLPPGSADVFKVLLVLDESGSMSGDVAEVKETVRAFANTLHDNATGAGQFQMGIVDFNSTASVGMNLTDANPNGFITTVENYLASGYSPASTTNFTAALTVVRDNFSGLDIVFFISDGNPVGDNINSWQPIANQIKCSGTYIFGIALGSGIDESNIIALSGPDELNNPKSLPQGADWLAEDISGLPDALVALANSLVDNQDPVVACPANITQANDARACGARAFYSVSATDNCTANPAITSTHPSGSNFPVGTTTVTCTATDEVGNTSNCSFTVTVEDTEAPIVNCGPDRIVNNGPGACSAKVNIPVFVADNCTASPAIACTPASGSDFPVGATTVTCTATDDAGNAGNCSVVIVVLDKEPPAITCPPDITVEVGDSTGPGNTGSPTATDNCAVNAVTHADKSLPGDCLGKSRIDRSWKASDSFANSNECIQAIKVVDTTPPVINTPPDIEVECDTSTAATGMATATDTGDPNPKLVYKDTIVSGHFNYKCTIERRWTATDDCGNSSTSVQVIEKDVTPRVQEALNMDIDGDGAADPLFLGLTASSNPTTFRVKPDEAGCIVRWLPDAKGRPTALRGGAQGVENGAGPAGCRPGSNPVNADGRLENPIFAEGLKLALYLRMHPEFGNVLLEDLDCPLNVIPLGLGPHNDIKSFMDAAHKALSNQNMTPHEREWLNIFRCIGGSIDFCD